METRPVVTSGSPKPSMDSLIRYGPVTVKRLVTTTNTRPATAPLR